MNITLTITQPVQPVYYRGLSDKDCNDPLGGIYTDKPYKPRNWPSRPSVPEVRKFYNGDSLSLVPNVEWTWYYCFALRNPSLPEDGLKNMWRKFMRDDAAFTNKRGTGSRRSFVLGTNTTKDPMQSEGVDCPGNQLYRGAGEPETKSGMLWTPVYNLDYDYLVNLADPRIFAASLPAWVVHTGRIVHNDYRVTDFDYRFPILLMTSRGRQEVIDGLHCRVNYMRTSRLKVAT